MDASFGTDIFSAWLESQPKVPSELENVNHVRFRASPQGTQCTTLGADHPGALESLQHVFHSHVALLTCLFPLSLVPEHDCRE